MSIFSLNWFKSKKQQQIEELKHELEVKKLVKQLESLDNPPTTCDRTTHPYVLMSTSTATNDVQQKDVLAKPYKKIKLVNNTLTVVLNDGSVISKPDATQEDFQLARNAFSEESLLAIVACPEIVSERKEKEEEMARAKSLRNGIDKLATLSDFRLEGDSVYLVGINRSLPQLLVEEFIFIADKNNFDGDALDNNEEFQSLKRFFMWCCLNPRAEVADELYRFLKENSFRITKQGFFVALRNVVTVRTDNEIVQFVSNAYNKVKAVWKKKPENFYVHKNEQTGEYYFNTKEFTEHNDLGNLQDLYLDLPNMAENRFTDDWTKTFDIRVGKVVNMPMEDCNWSTQDCAAAGLHFTSDQIHYVGCGDTSVLILINPMKVVGIGQHKGRCYEYLPIMTVPREEATEILHDLDFDTLELDEDYAIRELENLTEKAKDGFVAESKKYEFNMPQISTFEIKNIVASLDVMKFEISKRVVTLD